MRCAKVRIKRTAKWEFKTVKCPHCGVEIDLRDLYRYVLKMRCWVCNRKFKVKQELSDYPKPKRIVIRGQMKGE